MRDYDHKTKYYDRQGVKFRRCSGCKKLVTVDNLETRSLCKDCYLKKYSKKRCNVCGLRKIISCFYKISKTSDKYRATCKECVKIKNC